MRLFFDQGTILLEGLPRESKPTLRGLRWDARLSCHRALGHHYRDLRGSLQRQGLAFHDDVPGFVRDSSTWSSLDLEPHQHAALAAWQRDQRGLIVLPNASSKIRIACAAMAASATPALCLVPTRALMHQWAAEVQRHYHGSVRPLPDDDSPLASITVATFESAQRAMARIGNRFGILVIDEVPHLGSAVRGVALEMCIAPQRLALAATAPLGEASARLEQLVGPRICELRVEGRADADHIVIKAPLSEQERVRYAQTSRAFRAVFKRLRMFNPGATWREFTAFAARTDAGRKALTAFRQSRLLTQRGACKGDLLAALLRGHRGQRCLVLTADIASAYALAREHPITPMPCGVQRRERETVLDAFRRGELHTLVSAQTSIEGLDLPAVDVVIVVGGARGQLARCGVRLVHPSQRRALVYELIAEGTHEERVFADRWRGLAAG